MTTYSSLTHAKRQEYLQRARRAEENWGMDPNDYRRLALINHQLQQWYEKECNGQLEYDEDTGRWMQCFGMDEPGASILRLPTRDLVTGAINRAKTVANRCQGWIHLQKDPRGCVVYFWRLGEPGPRTIGPDEDISSVYATRALACFF